MTDCFDIAIAGAGPAGLVLASELAQRGVSVCVVDADAGLPWPATYGIWIDEADELGIDDCLAARAARTFVQVGAQPNDTAGEVEIGRGYARVDNAKLASRLRGRLADAGGIVRTGTVVGVVHEDRASTLSLQGGETLRARLVVDATGTRRALLGAEPAAEPIAQSAFGVVLEQGPHSSEDAAAVLMDFRPVDDDDHPKGGDATFLYRMPLGNGRVLWEETSLARRPAADPAHLERRLRRRLCTLGVVGREVATERVWIPMSTGLPRLGQRTLGYGTAAGMVHPATGYQLASALRRAPAFAGVIHQQLAETDDLDSVARACWAALWTKERLEARDLLLFGGELLVHLDGNDARRFFGAFFDLPMNDWRDFMRGEASFCRLVEVLGGAFDGFGWALQRKAALLLLTHRPGLLPQLVRRLPFRRMLELKLHRVRHPTPTGPLAGRAEAP